MISENILYAIGSRLYRRRRSKLRQRASTNRGNSADGYWQWQFDSSARYFDLFGDLLAQLPGQRVLDLGCGLGGRTCYLAGCGVAEIVGIDINAAEIDAAQRLAEQNLPLSIREKLSFHAGQEDQPSDLGAFDIVLLIDSMEHVRDPVAMLNLAHGYLEPGGLCYFSTMGWYHHRGSHINSIIPLPCVNLFCSDETILRVLRRIVSAPYYEPSQWDSAPPVARWEGIDDLRNRPGEYLNKITIAGLRRAVRASAFRAGDVHVEGFSAKRLKGLRFLNVLARIPILQEVYHSAVFGRLEKD